MHVAMHEFALWSVFSEALAGMAWCAKWLWAWFERGCWYIFPTLRHEEPMEIICSYLSLSIHSLTLPCLIPTIVWYCTHIYASPQNFEFQPNLTNHILISSHLAGGLHSHPGEKVQGRSFHFHFLHTNKQTPAPSSISTLILGLDVPAQPFLRLKGIGLEERALVGDLRDAREERRQVLQFGTALEQEHGAA
jgi:hypothetical protein